MKWSADADMLKRCGFRNRKHFEIWIEQLHADHPNPNEKYRAFAAVADLIISGTFDKDTCDRNYREWSKVWATRPFGKVENLWKFFSNGMWKNPPKLKDNRGGL